MSNINSGFLIINKPSGPTSHDIIDELRNITGIKKIGHAGTLDPLASGVLIMAIGQEATKKISQFVKLDKKYVATLHLGTVSDTHDRMGIIKELNPEYPELSPKAVNKVLIKFIGKQKQVPPMYSAKKVKGYKLYQLARKGERVKREPVDIEIYNIKLLSLNWPLMTLEVHCSSGTYIRALARDIGQKLSCGAYVEELRRTAVGKFKLKQAVSINKLNKNNWQDYLFN